jgi:hypothetical protein
MMPDKEGFEIIVNGVTRTYRDRRDIAYEAARYMKERHPRDFVEVRDVATGTKLIVFEDGRVG